MGFLDAQQTMDRAFGVHNWQLVLSNVRSYMFTLSTTKYIYIEGPDSGDITDDYLKWDSSFEEWVRNGGKVFINVNNDGTTLTERWILAERILVSPPKFYHELYFSEEIHPLTSLFPMKPGTFIADSEVQLGYCTFDRGFDYPDVLRGLAFTDVSQSVPAVIEVEFGLGRIVLASLAPTSSVADPIFSDYRKFMHIYLPGNTKISLNLTQLDRFYWYLSPINKDNYYDTLHTQSMDSVFGQGAWNFVSLESVADFYTSYILTFKPFRYSVYIYIDGPNLQGFFDKFETELVSWVYDGKGKLFLNTQSDLVLASASRGNILTIGDAPSSIFTLTMLRHQYYTGSGLDWDSTKVITLSGNEKTTRVWSKSGDGGIGIVEISFGGGSLVVSTLPPAQYMRYPMPVRKRQSSDGPSTNTVRTLIHKYYPCKYHPKLPFSILAPFFRSNF